MTGGEKRPLECGGEGKGEAPEWKRQRSPLASGIVEALKIDSLQKLCSSLEPLLRRVVGEEVERTLAKYVASKNGQRSSPKRIQGHDARHMRLQFCNKLALPLFTGGKVEGEHGSAIHVVLIDTDTKQIITSGFEASAKLEVVVLEGDFAPSDEDDWSKEEFENYVVRERDGKRPLLTGNLSLLLKEGVGTLGELCFTDNSSWIRSRKFRLGVRVSLDSCEGVRIREAKTEAFSVKDHRGELYKKHYPPSLHDEVWRLDKIGKDGAFHKRLNQAGILTVEDFLRYIVMDPQKLRNIIGSGMSNKMWDGTLEHAKTCALGGKLYVYYADEKQCIGVVFNNIFQLLGLISGGNYFSAESLADSEKLYVDKLVKIAYENWEKVVEYDGEALVDSSAYNARAQIPVPEHQFSKPESDTEKFQYLPSSRGDIDASTSEDIKPVLLSANHTQVPTTFSGNYPGLAHLPPVAAQPIFSLAPPESKMDPEILKNYPAMEGNTFEPMQALVSRAGSNDGNLMSKLPSRPAETDWLFHRELENEASQLQDFDLEEEIRQKSLEMLENEDIHSQMQQLLRLFNTVDGEQYLSPDIHTDEYPYLPEKRPASAKAYVGWLKLKAALRWGIFIRKRAAARRAQAEIVEVNDD